MWLDFLMSNVQIGYIGGALVLPCVFCLAAVDCGVPLYNGTKPLDSPDPWNTTYLQVMPTTAAYLCSAH